MAQCTASSSQSGNRCQRPAIKGGTVCYHHGGAAPQVRDKARQRLLEATDPLMAELIRLALHGDSEAVRVQAIRDALDRAGYKPSQKVEQELTVHERESDVDRSIAELMEKLARRGQSRTPMEADGTPEPA